MKFNRKDFNNLPFLKDAPESENYVIHKFSEEFLISFTYDPRFNYFMLRGPSWFRKLDGNGHELFSLPFSETRKLILLSHYVVDTHGVFDFSASTLKEEPFTTIINEDRLTEPVLLRKKIRELYEKADVVLFSPELEFYDGRGYCVYFKLTGQWTKLYTERHASQLNYKDIDPERENSYKSRHAKLVLLKDPIAGEFSDHTRQGDWYNVNPDNYKLTYKPVTTIKTRYYKSDWVFNTLPFTNIPFGWHGKASYKLKFKNENFYFQDEAYKAFLRKPQESFVFYILPDVYAHLSDVWFLDYKDPMNVSRTDCKGIYVIRKQIMVKS